MYSPLMVSVISGDISHAEALYAIRKKYLDSTNSLRFIEYLINEKYYMNEYIANA
jgi:hypothetical protein